ncbi:hypothetical protein NX801_11205 [Streptomyces sp. LP05-1]|uniref:Uncharacterized protein n=1 Tax=Streptomyces pyxinae TaxID=2970734 RepID=A0ABT2CFN2_9ACTN|nr:hypothetical protein [Streptomyces sp. LP05-1]MCS0636222.1 hypothetical protein [Streptomyces sp. LP05-1]
MAETASRTMAGARGRKPFVSSGVRPSGRRHPLVATAMVLPLAALLVVAFGGWDAVVAQASSVGMMLGR